MLEHLTAMQTMKFLQKKNKKFKSNNDSFMKDFINLKKEEMAKVEEKQKQILDVKKQEVAALQLMAQALAKMAGLPVTE